MSFAAHLLSAGSLLWACLFAAGLAAGAAPAANDTCLMCHADMAAKNGQGKLIGVDAAGYKASVHGEVQLTCVMCHADVADGKVPHADKLKPVDCAGCHEKAVADYRGTVHGKARADGKALAASCTDCHGTHDIKRSADPASRTNHHNIEATCSKCHGSDAYVEKAKLPGGNVGNKYHDSVHGLLLASKGPEKLMGPECSDCHGSHNIRAKDDPQSSVNRERIPETCGRCHDRIRVRYEDGKHGRMRQQGVTAAPGCNDCHTAHDIQRHDLPKFQLDVIKQCGTCHQDFITTYRDTFHGKVTNLGYTQVATCAACHGAHEMLPASDPLSKVSAANRLETCQGCHPGASANFASWDPHASKHDSARSPLYYWAARSMEVLLFGVFGFFGIHTVLWIYRSLRVRLAAGRHHGEETLTSTAIQRTGDPPDSVAAGATQRYYRRFEPVERVMHALLMLTFVGCALTGLPLLFSDQTRAVRFVRLVGGFETTTAIHHFCAVVMVVVFLSHVIRIFYRAMTSSNPLAMLWGQDSMVPQPQDVIDILQHFKWFVGKGPQPRFGRWTYWEKFDYWAVFWGMFIIGGSGLLLWFPVFFAKFLPGWIFNIATLVHGEEALLAAGFIFTFHFFNGHLRPEKFPMDTVIFSGVIPERELIDERPIEYARLVREGRLESLLAPAPARAALRFGWIVGGTALCLGVLAVVLIVYSIL